MALISKIKKSLNNKFITVIIGSCLLMVYSSNASAFACRTAAGAEIPIGGGSADVYVDLTPSVGVGQNLVVDLASQISCRNDVPATYIDYVSIQKGSAYGGVLENFKGSINYDNSTYPFPLDNETKAISYTSPTMVPWSARLYLTAIGSAGSGIAIQSGTLIAILNMHQTNNHGGSNSYIWRIFARNDVVIPTGGCDVSARDVTVTLPDYPGTAPVPLTVHCGKNQRLSYYLTGTTADAANSVFTNISSATPAAGVGVQLSNANGIIPANKNASLGTVGTSPVSLGLTASYGRTTGQVTAGNVQSIIGLTFLYE